MKKLDKTLLILVLALILALSTITLIACSNKEQLTATFDDSYVVYEGDSLDSLKPYLSVTYTDENGVDSIVHNYTLAGTLVAGKSELTVRYNELTTTVTLTVVEDTGSYTVTFVADGQTVATRTYTRENTSIEEPTVPQKYGYTGKWANYTLTRGDVTVNAVYSVKSYTVNINYDGADGGNTKKTINVTYGQAIGSLPTPTKTGYEFYAWYVNGELVTPFTVWTIDIDTPPSIDAVWLKVTDGLTYSYSSYNQSYAVTGIGTAKDVMNLVIPSSYQGYPVTTISKEAFKNNYDIITVYLPETINTIYSDAFLNCYSLVEVCNRSKLNLEKGLNYHGYVAVNALNIYNPQEGHSNLVTTDDGYMFYSDSDSNVLVRYLGDETELTLPNSYNGSSYSIFQHAFYNCSSLTDVTVPDSVTEIGFGAFYLCNNIESITLPFIGEHLDCGSIYHGTSESDFGWIFADNQVKNGHFVPLNDFVPATLTSVTITGGTIVPYMAFEWCFNITKVTLPQTITQIGGYAFAGLGFVDFTIPDSVQVIEGTAFEYCSSLKNLVIGKSVSILGYSTFNNCTSLESITVVDGNVTYHSDGNCLIETATKTLVLGCKTSVIPSDGSVTVIGFLAFGECAGLTSIVIPACITTIYEDAFYGCTNLESVIFENPNGWRIGNTEIPAEDLRNPTKAAEYLVSDTLEFWGTWTRED